MKSSERKSGIEVLGTIPWGTHFCMFYQTQGDLLEILVSYFKAGLENNEYCMWITSEPLNEKDAEKAMRMAIPKFDTYVQKNQIEIIPYTELYQENNEFDLQSVLNRWVDKYNGALDNGFNGLRLTGNTFWQEDKDWKVFNDFEEEISNIITSYNIIAVCAYSLEICGSFKILDAVRNHQCALFRREGTWEIFKGSDQTKFKHKLKKSEKKYRELLENMMEGYYALDLKGNFTFVNDYWCKTVGYSKEELLGKNFRLIFDEKTSKELFKMFNQLYKSGIPLPHTNRAKGLTNRGKQVFLEGFIDLIHDSEGNKIGFYGFAREVTEKIISEQKLRESEEILRSTLESTADGILVVDEYGQVTHTNSKFADMWRIPQDLIEKRDDQKLLDYVLSQLTDPEAFLSKVNQLYRSASEGFDTLLFKDGRIFDRLSSPLIHAGEIKGRVWSFRDVTKQKISEQKLKESEQRLASFMNSATDGFVLYDAQLNYIDVNKVTLQTIGMTKEEIIGKNILDIVPNLKETGRYDKYIEVIKTGKPFSTEDGIFNRIDGQSSSQLSIRAFKVGDNLGIIFTDITERKKKEKEIFDLAQFPSENPYPVLRVNRDEVIYINYAGQKLFNIIDYNQIPNIIKENVKHSFESNQITESEVRFGENFYSFTFTPIRGTNYVNIYGMDITERKHVEENLREVSKLKSEFLRRSSHELKTPLISIKGYSELILSLHEDQLDSSIISKLREINAGCDRLQNIINNLLKSSRLESPELRPSKQREDLSFLINFCVLELEPMAEKRKHSIKLDIHDQLYANIEKEEIHDVLSNLLSNAIKYTPPRGKIEIKTELKEELVVVSVKDNGIGFNEDQKKKLFQQFGKIERYGQGLDLEIDGTGLGLFISKRIVESHGGKIWMESEGKNMGSTFYFSLPKKIE